MLGGIAAEAELFAGRHTRYHLRDLRASVVKLLAPTVGRMGTSIAASKLVDGRAEHDHDEREIANG